MKINNKEVIKFTKDDIKSVRLDSHRYDTWATITLKTGVEKEVIVMNLNR